MAINIGSTTSTSGDLEPMMEMNTHLSLLPLRLLHQPQKLLLLLLTPSQLSRQKRKS